MTIPGFCRYSSAMEIPPIAPHRLAFDIDGVVADTAGAFLRIAAEEYGATHLSLDDIAEFDVEACLDLEPKVIRHIFQRLLEDPLGERLAPMPGAVAVLEELAGCADVVFVTARPLRAPIEAWLERHLGARARRRFCLVTTGDHDNKGDHLRRLGVETFIDDRLETCTALAAAGFSPIVFEQPWNRGRHRLPVVRDWRAIRQGLALPPVSEEHDHAPLSPLRPLPAAPAHR